MMKWLEIINFQYAGSQESEFKSNQLIPLLKKAQVEWQVTLQLFKNATIEGDLSIHIIHDSEPVITNGSPMSETLRVALEEFGLVHCSVWINKMSD
jgi:hypothetical protein